MRRLDDLMRETVHEMTDDLTPQPELARLAIVQGGRIRRRRQLMTVAAAVLAVVAVVTPLVVLQPSGAQIPATGPSPAASASPAPSAVTGVDAPPVFAGGWMVSSVGQWVFHRKTNTFVNMKLAPTQNLLPSPTGNRVLVASHGEQPIRPVLIDLDTGRSTKLDDLFTDGRTQWSPTGDRLLTSIVGSRIGFAVYDLGSKKTTKNYIHGYDCSTCEFVFTRDGGEVAMAIPDRSGGEAAELVRSVQLFDVVTGAPTRNLPIKAMPNSSFAWSPDGRFVLGVTDHLKSGMQLIDLSTGQARSFPYPAVWVTDDLLLAVDKKKIHTLRPDGTLVETKDISDLVASADPYDAVTLAPMA